MASVSEILQLAEFEPWTFNYQSRRNDHRRQRSNRSVEESTHSRLHCGQKILKSVKNVEKSFEADSWELPRGSKFGQKIKPLERSSGGHY